MRLLLHLAVGTLVAALLLIACLAISLYSLQLICTMLLGG